MNSQKDTEDFLEADKATEELIEILVSCAFETGERYGEYKGISAGWSEAFTVLNKHKENQPPDALYSEFAERFLDAVKNGDYKNSEKKVKPLLKETKILEKAAWKVLKRRLKL